MEDKSKINDDYSNGALKTILKGGVLFAIGNFSAQFFHFISGIIVIRILDKSEFGLISLGHMIVGIIAMISFLGFGSGLPRLISKYIIADRTGKKVNAIISTSLVTCMVVSSVSAVLLFGYSSTIADVLNKQNLAQILRFFSFMIPPLVLVNCICSIYRGFETLVPEILLNNIMKNITKFILLVLGLIVGFKLHGILIVNVATVWFVFVVCVIYSYKAVMKIEFNFTTQAFRKILAFSLPLMSIQFKDQILNWSVMILLGLTYSSEQVGLFAAPLKLTVLFPIPLMAIVSLYLPVVTKLFEKKDLMEINKLYLCFAKWSFIVTLPICLISILESRLVVTSLFGNDYVNSSSVLAILALGASVHSFLGPNGATLIAFGDNKIVFFASLGGLLAAIIPSFVLIDRYGPIGAAIAISTSSIIANTIMSLSLYLKYKIHPFHKNYIMPILFTLVVVISVYIIMNFIGIQRVEAHIAYSLFIIIIAVLSPFLSKSLNVVDLNILSLIEYKIHKKKTMCKKIENWIV